MQKRTSVLQRRRQRRFPAYLSIQHRQRLPHSIQFGLSTLRWRALRGVPDREGVAA